MAAVELSGVDKRFGDTVVVQGIDLTVDDGEFLVLLGPSGCGKSTVLRMVAGLEEPTTGTVTIGDQVVNGVDARLRDVSMVFQSYALYPHMTVAENIEAPLLGRGAVAPDGSSSRPGRAARRALVRDAAATLGLEDLLTRKPGALSGGQRQRVALARAIVRQPQVFLMDEPLSNLDAKLRTRTRLDLVDLWRRLGTTTIYVTHDQVEAMTMATRIAVMADGVIQQVGEPGTIYDDPDNLFVATFVGTPQLNVLDAAVIDGTSGDLPAGTTSIGVRPEHAELVVAGTEDDAGTDLVLDAEIRAVEALGHETQVVCSLDAGTSEVTVRQLPDAPVAPVGARVRVALQRDRLLAFDARGQRLR